jgi:hypothetical protein
MYRISATSTAAGALAAAALLARTPVGTASASGGSTGHRLTFTSHEIASANAGAGGHLLIESDRAVRAGHTIGYTANTCVFDFAAHEAHCTVTLARPKGQMRFKATVNADTGAITGRVVGGTGAYPGISGRVTGTPTSDPNVERITLDWKS